ncbi:MAG: alpha/beta hydrolase [Nocardioides sp.]
MTDPITTTLTARSPQGGDLEVLVSGPEDGRALLYHSGTPSGAAPFPLLWRAADRQGLRVVTYSRPGYGASTPREVPGTLADDVADSAAVLDAVGAGDFVTLGWSGGGPRALACAALLPDRCRAAATLAGVAPHHADGLDWFAGMGQENLDEFAAAEAGPEKLRAWLEENGAPAFRTTPEEIATSLGGLASPVDRAAITGEFADYLAATFRQAGRQGVRGWHHDDLLLLQPWPFDLAAIGVPVTVWQGDQDRMVPFDHGRWLVAQLSDPVAHLEIGEGHLSLVAQVDRIVAELVELAG